MKLLSGCFLVVAAAALVVLSACGQSNDGKTVTTTYAYDPASAQWVKNVEAVAQVAQEEGATPVPSNTIEIFLDEEEPVKAIIIAEALIRKGTQPLLEIAGQPNSVTSTRGDIRICNLIIKDVDAEELDIHDTEAVSFDSLDVAAKDNELDVEIEPVNVARCGRGGTSVISLGVERGDLDIENVEVNNNSSLLAILGKTKDSGLKVDRVRILGPEGKSGYVETVIVLRTSVFGRIEVRDVKVQDLLLNGISLDDNVTAP